MSHQRSKSIPSLSSDRLPSPPAEQAPLSISIPRKRSMSISFGLPTSPLSYTGPSIVSGSHNNPASNPQAPANSTFGTTPPTNFAGLPSSIPTTINRRFSSSFTNPLTNPFSGSTNAVGTQVEERSRGSSFFGSPTSQTHNNDRSLPSELPKTKENTGGGIGGLFRKFSTSRPGVAQHPMDSNEVGPSPAQQPGIGPLSNVTETNNNHGHGPAQPQLNGSNKDKTPRSGSPMANMILNGQMLD
ncbi:hypothetical protein BGX27_003053 [Mortierella sp. AM989]|nr:hypothetical protein BGX27_003053 [Mortierella sp. AM989]